MSVGRSASRHRVCTSGYRPCTRNDPPGGGLRRRDVAALASPSSPAGSPEDEGVAGETDVADADEEAVVEVGPTSRGVAVQAANTATIVAAVARAHDQRRRRIDRLEIISTTLPGLAADGLAKGLRGKSVTRPPSSP